MPQPLRFTDGLTFRGGADILLERPALAAQMGNIVANWVLIEDDLMILYGFLMGVYIDLKPGFAPPTHPVARQIFSVVESFNARLELVEELCKWVASDELESFSCFRKSVRRVSSGRNLVAHGNWRLCAKYPDDLILEPPFGHSIRYTLGDFRDINVRILEARKELRQIIQRFYQGREEHSRGLSEAPDLQ
ncbi:MAG: hypothetical protein V7672_01570 [Brevundimonas sp.]|uniref:hypothetical protein n=1 Tax=Brevundimonas sp. TaxID=1871086 RepID=UPI0030038BD4